MDEGWNGGIRQDSMDDWSKLFYESDENVGDGEWWQVPMDGGQGKTTEANRGAQRDVPSRKPTEAPSEPRARDSPAKAPRDPRAPTAETPANQDVSTRDTNGRWPAAGTMPIHTHEIQAATHSPANRETEHETTCEAPRDPRFPTAKTPANQDASTQDANGRWPGLAFPVLASGARVDGSNKRLHRRENKHKRISKQEAQEETSYWAWQQGLFAIPTPKARPKKWRNNMCPSNLALHHPAANTLLQYATGGCPTNTGTPWTRQQIQEAINRGPHSSAMDPQAMEQQLKEATDKEKKGQCRIVLWDDIKHEPPPQLKISPIAMIPHKSRQLRAILDLSF